MLYLVELYGLSLGLIGVGVQATEVSILLIEKYYFHIL